MQVWRVDTQEPKYACVCVCVCVLRRDTLASSATMHARSMSRILPRRLNHCMWFMSLASKFTEVRQVVVLEAVLGWVDGCNGWAHHH